MDKLEQYLDQVCRSIDGPRSMRQHLRRELREHLLDATAQQQAAGRSPDEALDRALAEFGTPDEMRSELEAAHGQRMLPVVIDKALQWKEMTMRAKWLWTTWVYVALAAVIALQVLFITFTVIFIVPKFELLVHRGVLDMEILTANAAQMLAFLRNLNAFTDKYTTYLVLFSALAWGLFEWRVRGENKSLMRMSALGTVATGLMLVVWLTAASLLVLFCLGAPTAGKVAKSSVAEQFAGIEMPSHNLNR